MSITLSRRTLLAGMTAALTAPVSASEPRAPFRRGASIHNMMNWASVQEGDKTRYRSPPFATPAHQLLPGVLANLKRAGLDFIRLTLDPGPFLQFTGNERDDLDRQLLAAIARLSEAGFGVVVDFHPNWQNPTYAPEKITALSDGPLTKAYGQMLARTARLLKPLSGGRIAFELMNEPQWGWDAPSTTRWQVIQKTWHDQVRAEAPDLMLVLTGARGGDREGLLAMDGLRYAGSNVLWSFHYYKPYLLTHQGVKGDNEMSRAWRHFSDLPYPAGPEHHDDAWRIIRRNIETSAEVKPQDRAAVLAQARKALKDYLDLKPGRALVAREFAEVAEWARRNGVPAQRIFLGEFGITRTYGPYRASPPQTLENYLSDVRGEAEAQGFGWAIWAVSGYGGMSLIREDDKPDLDEPTVRALGLATA
ncbi:MAG TPA: cellulase family glycosylhydrolase [Beijerinckiaceae bacterium]|nr:cellulase family glycosylhydrolase [Beijerinckiaceae bacterium]